MIYLVIYTAENCPTCQRVVDSAKEIVNRAPNVELSIKNIKDQKEYFLKYYIDQKHKAYCHINKNH